MHRVIRDHLEEVLAQSSAGRGLSESTAAESNCNQDLELHLRQCEECRTEIEFMREHATLLQQLRVGSVEQAEPKPGFYARVIERIDGHIDEQRAGSIWNVFSDSPFGKRIALASMTLAVVFGLYMVASESYPEQTASVPVQMMSNTVPDTLAGEDQPGMVLGSAGAPDRDTVLVNLVTYRKQ